MRLALDEARSAAAVGEVPVGAVIVLGDEVLGRGHNMVETLGDATAHAEMLAIRRAAEVQRTWRLNDATLYVTLEPCAMCSGASMLSRLGRIVFGASDPKFGACGSVVNVLADDLGWNHRLEVVSGVCAEASADLMRSFFRQRRGQ
jgi:tRNA(adenine34) deaminase